jgi:drug/metabolite transporter (DMT)-like permease
VTVERKHALYFAVCAGTIGFALAFIYPAFTPTRVFWYYALEHRWAFEEQPSALAMDFYGRTLLACLVGALTGAATYAVARRVRRQSAAAPRLFAAWMLTACLLAMALYGWELYHRVPIPEPLPDWYEPR